MMTASLIATLIKLFGPTLARILLATLLKGHINFGAIGYGDIAETLADSLDIGGLIDKVTGGDRKAVRNANYLFDKIGDEAAEKLVEVFQRDSGPLEEAEWINTIEAAKATLNQYGLALLIKQNLNAHDFRRALRNTAPAQPLESVTQEELYRRLLDTAAQVVFAIADTLPNFTRDTTAQLLQNEARLLQDMDTVLANQQRILAESYGQQKGEADRQFESEYRTLIANELDNLQLFGVEPFDGAKQPLSVAYIKLQVAMKNRGDYNERNVDFTSDHTMHVGINEKVLSTEQVLGAHDRLLIVSNAGSGKTTLLQWIAVQSARRNFEPPLQNWAGRLPFFIRLRDFTKSALPTFGQLTTTIRETKALADSVPDHWVEQQLRSGRTLVLLDGMDEVTNAKRQEAIEWLERLLSLYPATIVIVSSRPSGLTDPSLVQGLQRLAFKPIELLKLDDTQVLEFVQQWHAAMIDERCRYLDKSRVPVRQHVLVNALEKRQDLKSLASSPILCSMLCALNLFELGELPKDRIHLYDRCINILLRRDENREVDSSDYVERLRPDNARRRLARIAYWMMQSDPALIHRQDAERLLQAEGLVARPVLDFLAARSVVFRAQAVDEFDFIHRTFVEYLAAQEIVRAHEVRKVVHAYSTKSEWHETIRLLAGHVEPSDQAVLLNTLYMTAQIIPQQRRTLHCLALDFWDLLDVRTQDATEIMLQHLKSLNLGGSNFLSLLDTQISDLSAVAQLTHLQHLNLTDTQVSNLSALGGVVNLQQLNLHNTQVSNLSALAQLTNLQQLDLSNTLVSELSALTQLTNLQQLDLRNTQVSDLSALAQLTNLQQLYLRNTQVSDLSALAQLTNLQQLDLRNTQVSDLSVLAQLTNLRLSLQLNQLANLKGIALIRCLDLRHTPVSDLMVLAQLTNLQHLELSNTQVSDLSTLAQLTNLQHLSLRNTQVSDPSTLVGLTNLKYLDLSNTQVSDLSALAELTNLLHLDLGGTRVSDFTALTHLHNIQYLDLMNTQILDLIVLAHLSNLQYLSIRNTYTHDLTALMHLINLQRIDLGNTKVRDITTLLKLRNLYYLSLMHIQVDDLTTLAQLSNVQQLDLRDTWIRDVTPLGQLTNLQQLYLCDTQVNDIRPLGQLTNLQQLDLSNTQVSDVTALAALTNLQQLDLSNTQVHDVTALSKALPKLKIYS